MSFLIDQRPMSSDILETASQCARKAISVVNDPNSCRKEMDAVIAQEQCSLLQGLSANQSSPVVWANTYLRVGEISSQVLKTTQEGRLISPGEHYAFEATPAFKSDAPVVAEIHETIIASISKGCKSLTALFNEGWNDTRLGPQPTYTELVCIDNTLRCRNLESLDRFLLDEQEEFRWYVDVLFRHAWLNGVYVHMSYPNRDLFPLTAAGVFLMTRDVATWESGRFQHLAAFRFFILEISSALLQRRKVAAETAEAKARREQAEQRAELSEVFLHSYSKRGTAIYQKLLATELKSSAPDSARSLATTLETFTEELASGRLPTLTYNERTALTSVKLLQWYVSDAQTINDSQRYRRHFFFDGDPTPYDRSLGSLIVSSLASALLLLSSADEMANAYRTLFPEDHPVLPDWLGFACLLQRTDKEERLSLASGASERERFLAALSDYRNQTGQGLIIDFSEQELSQFHLRAPRQFKELAETWDDYSRRVKTYWSLWSKMIQECMLNAFIRYQYDAFKLSNSARSTLQFAVEKDDSDSLCLRLSNTFVRSEPIEPADQEELRPHGALHHSGRIGLGLKGNDVIMSDTLDIGYFAYRLGEVYRTESIAKPVPRGRSYGLEDLIQVDMRDRLYHTWFHSVFHVENQGAYYATSQTT